MEKREEVSERSEAKRSEAKRSEAKRSEAKRALMKTRNIYEPLLTKLTLFSIFLLARLSPAPLKTRLASLRSTQYLRKATLYRSGNMTDSDDEPDSEMNDDGQVSE